MTDYFWSTKTDDLTQEARIKLVIDTTSIGIWDWIDINKTEVYWNPTFYHLLGYEDLEFEASFDVFVSFLHPDDKQKTLDAINAHLDDSIPYDIEYRLLTKQMIYKWFRATGRALFDRENKPYRMLGTIENIEQRKHAEKESINVQERFQLAVDGANVGIWDWMDVHCSKQYWSPKFYHLLGYEPEEIEPSFENFTSLIHLEDQQRFLNKIDAHFIECVPFEIEYRLQLKNGSYHWFKGSGIASRNALGESIRMVGSIENIQKQKSAETQVIATLKKLASSNQNLEQFAYAASHDLQKPLRIVSSCLSLIERRYTDELPSETKEFFSIVTDGCQRMKVLFNDLLEYSQVREERDLYKTVDLRAVLSKLIKQYNQQNKLSIELNIPNSLVVLGIETYLIRLFGNLLSNAVKYQSPDRVLKVGIKVNETEETITIHITDNGIGIDEQFFEKIFELFQRLHSMSEYEGTGIGLSLCKKIVSMHQGDITVQSSLNEGSCFTVTLPKKPNKQ